MCWQTGSRWAPSGVEGLAQSMRLALPQVLRVRCPRPAFHRACPTTFSMGLKFEITNIPAPTLLLFSLLGAHPASHHPTRCPDATVWALMKQLHILGLIVLHTRTCVWSRALRSYLQSCPYKPPCALVCAAHTSTLPEPSHTPALHPADGRNLNLSHIMLLLESPMLQAG